MKIFDRITEIFIKIKKGIRLLFDSNIPFSYKLIPILGVIYIIYPFDFVNDLLPGLGQLDDIAIFGGALGIFIKLAEKYSRNNGKKTKNKNRR